jgi:hypothetical protein
MFVAYLYQIFIVHVPLKAFTLAHLHKKQHSAKAISYKKGEKTKDWQKLLTTAYLCIIICVYQKSKFYGGILS